jgi:hypothetical protein
MGTKLVPGKSCLFSIRIKCLAITMVGKGRGIPKGGAVYVEVMSDDF